MSHCAGQRRASTPGRTYYLDDTAGSDGYIGTSEHGAYKTIGKANGLTLRPGDRVLLKRGEDWSDAALTPANSGKPGRPIALGAYGSGARPIVVGTAGASAVNLENRSYLSVSGINAQATATSPAGFDMSPAHHITLTDCDASSSLYGGFWVYGAPADAHAVVISSCGAHEGVSFGITSDVTPGTSGPIDIRIEDCASYSNGTNDAAHHGIYCKYSPNVVVRRNTCYNNASGGIKVNSEDTDNSATGAQVYDNYCHDNHYGIIIAAEGGTYYNNLIVDSTTTGGWGVGIYWINAPRSVNNTVVHNTVVNSQLAGLAFYQDSTHTGHVIKNNLIVQDNAVVGDKKAIYLPNDGTSIGSLNTWNNNQYFSDNVADNHIVQRAPTTDLDLSGWQALAGEASSGNGDAAFVTEYSDLHLQNSSGAIARGDPAVGVAQDKDGVVRGAAVDAGAYEYTA